MLGIKLAQSRRERENWEACLPPCFRCVIQSLAPSKMVSGTRNMCSILGERRRVERTGRES